MSNRLSKETIEQIPILYNQIGNKSEVARRLNISLASVNKYLTVIAGEPLCEKKKSRNKVDDALIEKINTLYAEKRNMLQVAKELGISCGTVKRYLSEKNLNVNKKNYDERDALWYYILKLFGPESEEKPVSDWNVIQMNRFKKQGIPYKGQLLTLKYFFEVKKNSIEKAHGSIGIIPFQVASAELYYKNIEKKQNELTEMIMKQLEKDRVEIKYNPSDYIGRKKKKKEIDLNSI